MKRQMGGLEWEWWRAVVPQKLKEAHDSGCAHILVPFPPLFLLFSERFTFCCCHQSTRPCIMSSRRATGVISREIPIDGQVLSRIDLESMPQVLGAHGLEEKDSADRCCRASSTTRAASLLSSDLLGRSVLNISRASGARTSVSNLCGHGERRVPEAHAWHMVRTREDFCPRRSHDRSFVRVLLIF
jgi:hypothetical protein